MLHHTYTSFSGIFGTAVGVLLLVAYFRDPSIGLLYLGMGILITGFMPVEMWFRADRQIKKNPTMSESFHYVFSDQGILVRQGELEEQIEWDMCFKAATVAGSIVIYLTPVRAYIFPRQDLGDKRDLFVEMISTHMPSNKVKIRV